MSAFLRSAVSIGSLIAFTFVVPAIAQMQSPQRASSYPTQQPVSRYAPGYNAGGYGPAGYNPAATGYGYSQPRRTPNVAQAPRTQPTQRRPPIQRPIQRPAVRVAQSFGPTVPTYTGVPGFTPAAAPSAAPAYTPAATNYTTIAPENMMQAAAAAVAPMGHQMGAAGQTPMPPMAQQFAPAMNETAAPAIGMPVGGMPIAGPPVVAPAQHAVVEGVGCGGGYADPGYVGDGMLSGGMVGGGMGYGGGECCGEAPSAPVYAPTTSSSPKWFGGFYGLIMNRDKANEVYYLTQPSTLDSLHLSSRDASMEFSGGYEVRLGRIFQQGCWGMEFVYWELFPDDQTASVQTAQSGAAQLYTTTDYRDVHLNFNDAALPARGSIADNISENGAIVAARLRRSWDFQNIELNLMSGPLFGGGGLRAGQATPFGQGYAGLVGDGGCYGGGGSCYGPSVGGGDCGGCGDSCGSPCDDLYAAPCGTGGCGPRLQVGWLFGVRYFKFDESLGLDYDIADNVYDGDANFEFQHDVRVENDLVGCQLGLNLNYALTNCLSLDGGTKFGLFGNHISHRQTIQNGQGMAYVLDADGSQRDYDISADDEDIAFLGEFRLGAAYKIGCHWRLSGGYRALALSGVGLATNQLSYARSHTDLGKVGDVDRNGHLILHGAYAGVEFCW